MTEEEKTKAYHEARAKSTWQPFAGEPITVEDMGGAMYAYGSELAMLRLEHKMMCGRAKYSENLKTWYYVLERKY